MSIYMDNAATSLLKPPAVAQSIYEAIQSGLYGNPSRGAHGYSLNAHRIMEETREKIKELFHAGKDYEVAFSANSTNALNAVLKGLLNAGDHVISTVWEHNSVLRPLYQLEKSGVTVDFVSASEKFGRLNYSEFEKKLRPETKMLVCNHASNVIGNIIDLAWIKNFCAKHHLLLVIDASQTAGAIPIDMSDGIISALCFTGHKSLGGPTGTGGVCLKKDLKLKALISGGSGIQTFSKEQPCEIPAVLEAGTQNILGIVGLRAGVEYCLSESVKELLEKMQILSQVFLEGLSSIPKLTLYGSFNSERLDVFSLNFEGIDSAVISDILWEKYEIATRSGYHCAPLLHEFLGTRLQGAVRFSFSRFTSIEEVKVTLLALKEISGQL